ncbi:hypothetical protein B296_00030301 [Ensete ventricosum]|uniref:Uncharacterized protein n=1 Tax=Ensete ventricosum TaxID=4639 RepID=A0A426YDM1_ENSVE|nr:hypothetical protein B296_00030301 [Ensete ventricosum]
MRGEITYYSRSGRESVVTYTVIKDLRVNRRRLFGERTFPTSTFQRGRRAKESEGMMFMRGRHRENRAAADVVAPANVARLWRKTMRVTH